MGPLSDTNPDFQPYLVAENVSNFALDDPAFVDTLFLKETFNIGNLRLGPFVQNITCVPNTLDCIQPVQIPCTQGMHNVFMTQPNLISQLACPMDRLQPQFSSSPSA
jgi:hypothetical protein